MQDFSGTQAERPGLSAIVHDFPHTAARGTQLWARANWLWPTELHSPRLCAWAAPSERCAKQPTPHTDGWGRDLHTAVQEGSSERCYSCTEAAAAPLAGFLLWTKHTNNQCLRKKYGFILLGREDAEGIWGRIPAYFPKRRELVHRGRNSTNRCLEPYWWHLF